MTSTLAESTLASLKELEDPKILAVNERHGDDHAVNLTKLRAVAKELKKNQPLARELWATNDTAARLVALLICRPKEFDQSELDSMILEARTPKVLDWLINYVVKKNPHWNDLRVLWLEDAAENVAAAGWALNTHAVITKPEALDDSAILDTIEAQMKTAEPRVQWSMNECLAQIGIHRPELRDRAIAIGKRLEVLKDYPTPPNCTSPFAPIWIEEMVRRQK
ncbi:DNA alkylation repair protein [[Brevibacterium] flavum]|uniref:DNA alkylation repair protein n=1 Tax=[Brevibacterium] flavum TaxID=92706 RepID=A0A0F6SR71_9CORY|nr:MULTISPECIES: DNA alkylation repair protein [Corynebacterium]AKF27449.1 DNA alkylation repair protein [[Brevibacterium] flavum]ANE08275.1 DNA alkylation repair protein [Corynebacterium glutamicum]KEI23193.1 DNA alkylation repair protein [Corynebacterium glutamicum ATCC 14067]KIH73717.1 DNA alkylation repair protein [Corynebacterium glutamicum]OKX95713.1 DNA alkylation repair protein [Corynebacterium glutamicum]